MSSSKAHDSSLTHAASSASAANSAAKTTLSDEAARARREELSARIRVALEAGGTNIDSVAQRLGISRGTLQRHLRACGTNYRTVVDEWRSRVARELVQDPTLTVLQRAHRAGFAGANAFRQALRRWQSAPPGDAPPPSGVSESE